jgi:hypothetical protein
MYMPTTTGLGARVPRRRARVRFVRGLRGFRSGLGDDGDEGDSGYDGTDMGGDTGVADQAPVYSSPVSTDLTTTGDYATQSDLDTWYNDIMGNSDALSPSAILAAANANLPSLSTIESDVNSWESSLFNPSTSGLTSEQAAAESAAAGIPTDISSFLKSLSSSGTASSGSGGGMPISGGGGSSGTSAAIAALTKALSQMISPQATATVNGQTVSGPASLVSSLFGSSATSSSSSLTMILLLGGAAIVLIMLMGRSGK